MIIGPPWRLYSWGPNSKARSQIYGDKIDGREKIAQETHMMGVFRFSFVECKTDGISQSRLVIFDSYLVECSEIYLQLYFMVERY